ncbi:Homeodomain-like DNA binding domain-containing transcription factor [Phycomyces blakesleeanus NRRL 1555(-)]|uniref:Homeodomain-like DNA binding domain-containing transcription factor n=1 Tax=Phycomyces blakesleeanus (strain ATCC 8743b / DSM 1359 / FGSC 10004 / NBRC 33097 / NRRL 1555) TaxID=763407 RepID=A0A167JPM4_PHYB8|nr:Homeodomain-like DNA binding domain-containing transcription factor [Phycomyces blakesleeanus NRRL 1555(-)]OAD66447.1 Homeodomain-like DNA binding domain-containing transcription factor [Phycomyces blakesleeanus NRRL 1555(-)]|eukprot:XP_018284487.1 Homeodomain-like DNA binding domain-containing transcription factor [Phycomyces blakesleeanus NRRL 1555(-)]
MMSLCDQHQLRMFRKENRIFRDRVFLQSNTSIFLFEDGHGNVVDENGGPEPMKYIVDQDGVVGETIATHTEYLKSATSSETSPTCPMLMEKPKDEDVHMKDPNIKRDYIEKCVSASATAKQLGIHIRTAQRRVKQYNMRPDSIFDVSKQVGRKCVLNDEHKKIVAKFIDANLSTAVVEATEHLLNRFKGLKVLCNTVHKFMKSECNLSLKKSDFPSIKRNSPAKIEERHDWDCKWENTVYKDPKKSYEQLKPLLPSYVNIVC